MLLFRLYAIRAVLQLLRCSVLLLALPLINPARGETSRCWSRLDGQGVALFDYGGDIGVQYNATTIGQLAYACYLGYRRSRLPEDWRFITAQINWLRNNTVLIADDAAVYNHNFPWSFFGFRPGWRSGGSQTNAIRAMIMYYRESGDESILPVIRRIKNGMMLPVSQGGTVATTPEGGIWIEEFPSDPPSLVLGSFIGSIIALHEFVGLFPDDDRAKKEFEIAVASLKTSLKHYDSGNWMYVYRWPGLNRPATADEVYGSAIPRVLLELWKDTQDPLFLATGLRWQSFFENVHFRSEGNVRSDEHGTYRLVPGLPKRELIDALKNNFDIGSIGPESFRDYGPDELFDNSIDTYLSMFPGPAHIHLRLKEPRLVNTLRLSLYNVELYPEDLAIAIKAEGKADFKNISFERETSRRYIYYRFDPLWADELRITATRFSQQDRLIISGLAVGSMNWENRDKPVYCSHTTPPVQLDSPGFRVRLEAPLESAKEIYVIYRHAPDRERLQSSPWQWDFVNPFEPREIAATDRNDKIYQFRVLCTPEVGHRGWRGLTIMKPDNEIAYRE